MLSKKKHYFTFCILAIDCIREPHCGGKSWIVQVLFVFIVDKVLNKFSIHFKTLSASFRVVNYETNDMGEVKYFAQF